MGIEVEPNKTFRFASNNARISPHILLSSSIGAKWPRILVWPNERRRKLRRLQILVCFVVIEARWGLRLSPTKPSELRRIMPG
ncbi:hypothetical protein ES319_A02G128800v1 [Gossypium barbadense]|uniref:Uncharacterized protein n=1 Tax=Gossypium barbadense TaxID=3634 RepID=A0A5J5WR51_GOSBA|nr:hypothetical protein ES319_A02G128800v1 [Gossypium barbadense]